MDYISILSFVLTALVIFHLDCRQTDATHHPTHASDTAV